MDSRQPVPGFNYKADLAGGQFRRRQLPWHLRLFYWLVWTEYGWWATDWGTSVIRTRSRSKVVVSVWRTTGPDKIGPGNALPWLEKRIRPLFAPDAPKDARWTWHPKMAKLNWDT